MPVSASLSYPDAQRAGGSCFTSTEWAGLYALYSLFDVAVLTGLLQSLLFTALPVTRRGHFCGGKVQGINKRKESKCVTGAGAKDPGVTFPEPTLPDCSWLSERPKIQEGK